MEKHGANARQHGGDHYKKMAYEHWDFVCDTNQPYLIGCATKYASRWRSKNGHQDLEKMIHYLDKADERNITRSSHFKVDVVRFVEQLEFNDAVLVSDIMAGLHNKARDHARWMMSDSA